MLTRETAAHVPTVRRDVVSVERHVSTNTLNEHAFKTIVRIPHFFREDRDRRRWIAVLDSSLKVSK